MYKCFSIECIRDYRKRLEKEISSYMGMEVNPRSADAIEAMLTALDHVKELERMKEEKASYENFSEEDMHTWLDGMVNSDGTYGPHWTVEQTSTIKYPEEISPLCWNVVMNMMYSDYYKVAIRYGINNTGFYADMAKAFLMDEDATSPKEKVEGYFYGVVKR